MEVYSQFEKISETSSIQTYRIKIQQTVKDILKLLNLEEKYFTVLVNGKKVALNEILNKDAEIIILPRIAGGLTGSFLIYK